MNKVLDKLFGNKSVDSEWAKFPANKNIYDHDKVQDGIEKGQKVVILLPQEYGSMNLVDLCQTLPEGDIPWGIKII